MQLNKQFANFWRIPGSFWTPPDQTLDEHHQVDIVVRAPARPTPGISAFHLPAPLALQVTLNHGNWSKRAKFAEHARIGAVCAVYVEILGSALTPEIGNALTAGLTALFYDRQAPATALLIVEPNRYQCFNLAQLVENYCAWLDLRIEEKIRGEIVWWEPEKKYGFIRATLPGPEGKPAEIRFFFHLNGITNVELRTHLAELTIRGEFPHAQRLAVCFEESPKRDGDSWNKAAVDIQRATVP